MDIAADLTASFTANRNFDNYASDAMLCAAVHYLPHIDRRGQLQVEWHYVE